MLRDVDDQLESEFGWSQDDIAWEAHFGGPDGVGWVLKIRDDLPMGDIIRAVDAGIGPLAGAVVRARITWWSQRARRPRSELGGRPRAGGAGRSGSDVRDPRLHPLRRRLRCRREGLAVRPPMSAGSRSSARSRSPSAASWRRSGSGPSGPTSSTGCAAETCRHRPGVRAGLPAPAADPLGGRIGWNLGDPVVAAGWRWRRSCRSPSAPTSGPRGHASSSLGSWAQNTVTSSPFAAWSSRSRSWLAWRSLLSCASIVWNARRVGGQVRGAALLPGVEVGVAGVQEPATSGGVRRRRRGRGCARAAAPARRRRPAR